MHSGPVPADGGRDEDPAWCAPEPEDWQPVITRPDPLTKEEWLASLDATTREDEPPADEEEWAQGWTQDWTEDGAEIGASPAAQFVTAQFTVAAQFATGMPLDVMPGRAELAQFADEAAGLDDSFIGASEDELLGVLRAWDRVQAHGAPPGKCRRCPLDCSISVARTASSPPAGPYAHTDHRTRCRGGEPYGPSLPAVPG